MKVANTGLPGYSTPTASAIGESRCMLFNSTQVTLGDDSFWLKYGTFARANLYPDAAKLEHMRAHVLTDGTFTPAASFARVASNGAGTYVAVDGDITSVRVSTDYGQTWSNVVHNLSSPANDVLWDGAQFVVVGSSTTNIFRSTSPTGAVFTAAASLSLSGLISSSARVAFSGALYYFAAAQTGGAGVVYSSATAGGSVTSRWTNPINIDTANYSLSAGGGRALVTVGTTTAAARIVDGSSSVGVTLPYNPSSGEKNTYFNGNFVIFISGGSPSYIVSPDLVTFSSLRSAASNRMGESAIINGRLAIGGNNGIQFTTDLVNWTLQCTNFNPNTSGGTVSGDSKSLIWLAANQGSKYGLTTYDNPNYVGKSETASGSNLIFYARVA